MVSSGGQAVAQVIGEARPPRETGLRPPTSWQRFLANPWAIALVAALGPGLVNAMIAVAVVNISFYARGVRSAVLLLREQEFIVGARAAGATEGRILRRHVLPNILAPILVFVAMNIGWMITETAGLSFIGLGAQPPSADWGTMLADGRQFITVASHVAAIPGLALFILVLGLNLAGDGLRDAFDPRLRSAHAPHTEE